MSPKKSNQRTPRDRRPTASKSKRKDPPPPRGKSGKSGVKRSGPPGVGEESDVRENGQSTPATMTPPPGTSAGREPPMPKEVGPPSASIGGASATPEAAAIGPPMPPCNGTQTAAVQRSPVNDSWNPLTWYRQQSLLVRCIILLLLVAAGLGEIVPLLMEADQCKLAEEVIHALCPAPHDERTTLPAG